MNTLSVHELTMGIEALLNTQVRVRGTLVVIQEGFYLVELGTPADSWEDETRVVVNQEGLLDLMLSRVPTRVGGRFYYYDSAVITAVVDRSDYHDAVAVLHSPTEIRVERPPHEYDVIP